MNIGNQCNILFRLNNLNKFNNYDDIFNFVVNKYKSHNRNKSLHPNLLNFLVKYSEKNKYECRISFREKSISINEKEIIIGEQLTYSYYIFNYLLQNIKCDELKNELFQKSDILGWYSTNIKTEHCYKTAFGNKRRCDLIITLHNNIDIIIEINEPQHKKSRYEDSHRLNEIYMNNSEIKKIYYLPTELLPQDKLRNFVIDKLIPDLHDLSNMHDEKKFVISELKKIDNDNSKEWNDLLENLYDAHTNKNIPVVELDRLDEYFEIKLTEKIIERQQILYNEEKRRENEVEGENLNRDIEIDDDDDDDDYDDDDDDYDDDDGKSEAIFIIEKNEDKEEIRYHPDKIFDKNKKKLTWDGVLLYFTTFIKYNNNIMKELRFEKFYNGIFTNLVQVYRDKYNQIINKNNNNIWGLCEDDFKNL